MRPRRILAVILALGLLASACGDDDSTADETAADTAASDQAEPAAEAPSDEPMDEPMDEAMDDMHADWPDKIVFGFVPSQEQESLQDDIQPFISVLEDALGIDVEGVVTTDYTGLVTAMGTGQADLGAFGPFGYVLGKDQFGNIEALIQSIRFGSPTYHGQYMTNDPDTFCTDAPAEATALENRDGEVVQVGALEAVALQVGVFFGDEGKQLGETLDDGTPVSPGYSCIGDLSRIAGARVAFTSESSTSGYLFPALQLTQLGIDPAADIEAIFAGGHDASVTAVYNGDATVGLSFDDARRTIRKENPDVGMRNVVFAITPEIPNDVVAVRSDLPQSLKDAIFDAVDSYLDTDEGQEIFDSIYGWTDIRRAIESDFDVVRDAANTLGITEPID